MSDLLAWLWAILCECDSIDRHENRGCHGDLVGASFILGEEIFRFHWDSAIVGEGEDTFCSSPEFAFRREFILRRLLRAIHPGAAVKSSEVGEVDSFQWKRVRAVVLTGSRFLSPSNSMQKARRMLKWSRRAKFTVCP